MTAIRQSSLRVTGLFAGVGGIELGMARAGHRTQLLCERDPAALAVLRRRFPNVPISEDITELDSLPAATDLVTAGFPCQDLSQAGQTRGISGAKSGLVDHVFRLLDRQQVPWVLIENVPFMLRLNRGQAMTILTERLETLGYRWAYRVIDSRSFGLPQRRRRVFLLGSITHDPAPILLTPESGEPTVECAPDCACGFYWTEGTRGLGWAVNAIPTLKGGSSLGIPSAPAIWMPDGSIVKPGITDAERLQGLPRDWTKPASNVGLDRDRWRLVGNAVSVPVAQWIGRRLADCLAGERMDEIGGAPQRGKWPDCCWRCDRKLTISRSAFPVRRKPKSLADFLKDPSPLSARATAGFLRRLQASSLKHPPEFARALETHLAMVG